MVKDTLLYDRLEILSNATDSDIKKAYAKMSKQWHPDKNPNNIEESTKKFQEINEAKEILLNSDKRSIYDQIGMDVINGNNHQPQQHNSSFFQDIINQHFNSTFNFNFNMNGNNNKHDTPENIVANLHVTLEQLYNQENVSFSYKQKYFCDKCNGYGTKQGTSPTCSGCSGKGIKVQIIQQGHMIQQLMTTCNQCNGSGKHCSNNDNCEICNGLGNNLKDKTISVPLKAGLTTGNKISLNGKGHQMMNTKTDLILNIVEIPHNIFKREQDNLLIDIELKLYQALLGFSKIINFLNGQKLNINFLGKTDFGNIKIIENYGMHKLNTDKKGNLIIKFNFLLPDIHNDLKLQIKTLLQDKDEINNENEIQQLNNITKINL
jgi:DnaJ family protein A protein 2